MRRQEISGEAERQVGGLVRTKREEIDQRKREQKQNKDEKPETKDDKGKGERKVAVGVGEEG